MPQVSKVVVTCYKAQPESLKALTTPPATNTASQGGEPESALSWPSLMPRLLAHLGSDSVRRTFLGTYLGEEVEEKG